MDSSSDEGSRKRAAAAKTESAAADGSTPPIPWKKRRGGDMPKRPLSAYNIFFQDERQRILEEMNVSQHSLLHGRGSPGSQPSTPPQPVKFSELSRHIAAKWNGLGEDAKGLYQALAEKEQIRYAREMVYWNAQSGGPLTTPKKIKDKNRGDDSPSSSSSSASIQQDESPAVLSGPWQDATMDKAKRRGLEGVINSPNTKVDATPSMRPASPMRYALDSQLPLFSAALPSRQNPATNFQWSKLKVPEPVAFPFPLRGEVPQQQQLQQQQQQTLQQEATFTTMFPPHPQPEVQMPSPPPVAALQPSYPSLPNTATTAAAAAAPKPYMSPSMQQLSDDLDDEEQDFLISSLTGKSQQPQGKRGKRKR